MLICLLLLGMIPITSAINADTILEDPEETALGRTMIRGFVFNFRPNGFGYKFLALRIHYIEITGTQRSSGVLIMKQCTVGRETNFGFKLIGPAGFFGYMLASTYRGGINY
jgi:hypothetical protein